MMAQSSHEWHRLIINKCGVPACSRMKQKGAYCDYHHDVIYDERATRNKNPHDYTPRFTFDHWCKGSYY